MSRMAAVPFEQAEPDEGGAFVSREARRAKIPRYWFFFILRGNAFILEKATLSAYKYLHGATDDNSVKQNILNYIRSEKREKKGGHQRNSSLFLHLIRNCPYIFLELGHPQDRTSK